MKVTALIEKALPEVTGVSKSGNPWRKREWVCLYDNHNQQYPKRVLLYAMNDQIDALGLQQGLAYVLEYDSEVNENNGRYYQSNRLWRAALVQTQQPAAAAPQPYAPAAPQPPMQTAAPQAPYGQPQQYPQPQPYAQVAPQPQGVAHNDPLPF